MPIGLHLKPKWLTRRRKYTTEGGRERLGRVEETSDYLPNKRWQRFLLPPISLSHFRKWFRPPARSTPLKSTINPIFLIRVTVSSTSSPKFFASIIRMSVEVFRAVNSPCVMRSRSLQGTPVDIWAVLSLPPWRRASITRIHPSRPI